jgi:transcriptional regulator with XRE-family HTH domain
MDMSSTNKRLEEIAQTIAKFRKGLQLTQEQLAGRLGVSRLAMLRWESGHSQPSVETYIRLAKLAEKESPADALWFWEQAGLDLDTLQDLLPGLKKSLKEFQKEQANAVTETSGEVIRVPLLRDLKSIDRQSLSTQEVSQYLAFPARYMPEPAKLRAFAVDAGTANSTFHKGDLTVVDVSRTALQSLWEKVVLANFDPLSPGQDYWHDRPAGLFMGRLNLDHFPLPGGARYSAVLRQTLSRAGVIDPGTPIASWGYTGGDSYSNQRREQAKSAMQLGAGVRILGQMVCWISAEACDQEAKSADREQK